MGIHRSAQPACVHDLARTYRCAMPSIVVLDPHVIRRNFAAGPSHGIEDMRNEVIHAGGVDDLGVLPIPLQKYRSRLLNSFSARFFFGCLDPLMQLLELLLRPPVLGVGRRDIKRLPPPLAFRLGLVGGAGRHTRGC